MAVTPGPGCTWTQGAPDYQPYHDAEWGVPVYSDRTMFEHLLLETFQSGLSWLLILRRRSAFSAAFHAFDPVRVAAMTPADVARLTADPGIVRNAAKVRAAVTNARATLRMRERDGLGLAEYFWRWVGFRPRDGQRQRMSDAPARTQLSERIAADLKRRGFKFVGATNVYAHLQATGLVNDHAVSCPRHAEVGRMAWGEAQWREKGVDVGVWGDGTAMEAEAEALERRSEKAVKPEKAGRRKETGKLGKVKEVTDSVGGKSARRGEASESGRRKSRRLAGIPP